MDSDLPFYYWTLNERYSDEAYPSFDNRPDADEDVDARNHPLRLHRLGINQREDSSIFVVGRALIFLPVIARPYASRSIGLEIISLQHLAKKKLC